MLVLINANSISFKIEINLKSSSLCEFIKEIRYDTRTNMAKRNLIGLQCRECSKER